MGFEKPVRFVREKKGELPPEPLCKRYRFLRREEVGKRRISLGVPPGWVIVFLPAELARPLGEYDRALYTQIRASFLTARCDSESHVARKGLGRASGEGLAAPKFCSESESKELQT